MKSVFLLGVLMLVGGCGASASSDSPGTGEGSGLETEISELRPVRGTRFLVASLYAEQRRMSYSSDSYFGGAAINHLFYDLDTRTGRWLFRGGGQRILETHLLSGSPAQGTNATITNATITSDQEDDPIRAFLYRVASQDTNGDGDLDSDDTSVLAASGADGIGYAVLVPSVERFLGAFWVDQDHVLLGFESGGVVRGVEFAINKREVTRHVEFPIAPSP